MTDTVTAIVFNSIIYGPATYTYVTQVDQVSRQLENDSTTESQTFTIPTPATWTTWDTVTWPDLSASLVDVISSPSVPLPGIGAQPDSIAFTRTGAINAGQASPQSVKNTYSASAATIIVPPQSTYEFQFGGYEQDATVPFTIYGDEYYASGASAPFVGNGVVLSDDTGVFTQTITCVSTPGGCPVGSPAPVPEPATFVTVPVAFAAMLLLAAVRRRRSGGRRGGFGMLMPA